MKLLLLLAVLLTSISSFACEEDDRALLADDFMVLNLDYYEAISSYQPNCTTGCISRIEYQEINSIYDSEYTRINNQLQACAKPANKLKCTQAIGEIIASTRRFTNERLSTTGISRERKIVLIGQISRAVESAIYACN